MAPALFEFLLIDFRPQSDLMFWDQLNRSIAGANRDGRWICLVVGCAENIERVLLQSGYSTERSEMDELDLPSGVSEKLDIVLREEKHRISTQLTDEGVAAVGMMAFDRGMVRAMQEGLAVKPNPETRLWQAPGVVPVVMSVVKDETGRLIDVHPIRLCLELSKSWPNNAKFSVLCHHGDLRQLKSPLSMNDEALKQLLRLGSVSPRLENAHNRANWSIISPKF